MSCNLANFYHNFIWICSFCFQDIRRHSPLHCAQPTNLLLLDRYVCHLTRSLSALINPETFSCSTALKMQAAGSVQTSVSNCQSTQRRIAECLNTYEQRCGTLGALLNLLKPDGYLTYHHV